MLERQQQLGFIREQQIHVRPGEPHEHLWIFKIRVRGFAVRDFKLELEVARAGDSPQELGNTRSD